MALALNTEIESVLKNAFKHLHCSNIDSAEKIRLALDEIIKTRFGSSKMLIHTLNKKIIQEESCLPEATKTADLRDGTSAIKTCTSLYSSDAISIASEEENLTEFGDLACVLCGAMVVAAGNRLLECSECHSLYHQECHKPPIPDIAEDCPWFCYNCKNKYVNQNVCSKMPTNDEEQSTEAAQYLKSPEVLTIVPSSVKNCTSEVTTTSTTNTATSITTTSTAGATTNTTTTNKDEPNSQLTTSSVPNATINIVSSDKRLKLMKKQTKHHDGKRKK